MGDKFEGGKLAKLIIQGFVLFYITFSE